MSTATASVMREQLLDRRRRLETAVTEVADDTELVRLLDEVDSALNRMDLGTYGLCEVCHDPIESERLLADPLVRFCLGDLTRAQRHALEEDLELAVQIQQGLLPQKHLHLGEWEVCYHYEPAGQVSGDYCDLVEAEDGSFYFILGDVSGKGIAASMLMAHLQAMFRTLISVGLPLNQIVERASRVFCESTLPTHFATLVFGRANGSGEIEICNAGHLPPLVIGAGKVESIEATGLPVGIFCNEQFTSSVVRLAADETLFLYTDGFSETRDRMGTEYGVQRLHAFVREHHALTPEAMIGHCMAELTAFRAEVPTTDDLTIMAIRRNGRLH